jgi:SAM-dependent methyltransferase
MAGAEFDHIAADYARQHAQSISLSGEAPEFFAEYKIATVEAEVVARGLSPARILDFGAGVGNALLPMRRAFPTAGITCLDVSDMSLDICRLKARNTPDISLTDFVCYDGISLPFPDDHFDLVFTACVFHHIPHDRHVPLLREIRRVLSPSGMFHLFEHNPWNPLTLQAVRNCPFDANAELISAPALSRRLREAGFTRVDRAYRLFFPAALARLRRFERLLTGLPLGAQYSLIGEG